MKIDSNLIAAIALVVSILSLTLSALGYLRDRNRIKTSSIFYSGHEEYAPYIRIRVVNHGRRVAILKMLGGTVSKGIWSATYLNDKSQKGISISEHQFYEEDFYEQDLCYSGPDGDFGIYKELWVEDSLGKKHRIKKSKENIIALLAAHGHAHE